MKKTLSIILFMALILITTACGESDTDSGSVSSENENQIEALVGDAETGAEEEMIEEKAAEEDVAEDQTQENASDTISSNGYTVKIVDLHKTKDSNGDPIAATEFLFTNENVEPVSFMGATSITAFQNGIELTKDEMVLEDDYDWDSYYTEIKDGATISVFHAIPLQNETDPVELSVDIMDFSDWSALASTTVKFDLNLEPEEEDIGVEESSFDNEALVEQYLASVKYIYENKVDLFGNEVESFSKNEDANQFAIEDVDHDGVPELILSWADCSMVNMWGGVYQFDFENDNYIDEGIHDDSILFYENGIAITMASHNHSNGEMWPYILYMYNPDEDKYEFMFSAYSWEKQYKEDGFPEDADTDNVGIVYYIDDDVESTEEAKPISQTQYNDVYNQYFSDTQELIPAYYPLSEVGIEEYRDVLDVLEYERTH